MENIENIYVLLNCKETDKGLDINGARIYKGSDLVLEIRQSTPKGWASKKAIIADFDWVENDTDWACTVRIISDEVAQRLIETYSEVKVKFYDAHPLDSKGALINALVFEVGLGDLGDTQGDCYQSQIARGTI